MFRSKFRANPFLEGTLSAVDRIVKTPCFVHRIMFWLPRQIGIIVSGTGSLATVLYTRLCRTKGMVGRVTIEFVFLISRVPESNKSRKAPYVIIIRGAPYGEETLMRFENCRVFFLPRSPAA